MYPSFLMLDSPILIWLHLLGEILRVMCLSIVRQGLDFVANLCSPLQCRLHGRVSYRLLIGIAQSS